MQESIVGIHHVTAVAGDPQRNLEFYSGFLGLRLVKKTVNFDDPGTYHFYFGDSRGRPGTILTFFPWPNARPGHAGNGQAAVTSFSVPPDALGYWQERLERRGIAPDPGKLRPGERFLRLRDPDGLLVELVETESRPEHSWTGTIPRDFAIFGIHGVTLKLETAEATAELLRDLGFQQSGSEGNRVRYSGTGLPGSHIDLVTGEAGFGRIGAGTIHHVALRAADEGVQLYWRDRLVRRGFRVSPVMDRQYFRSIYFREPGGVLFEIATDGPGFTLDEPEQELGRGLKLPPWLERDRTNIERILPRLETPESDVSEMEAGRGR